MDIKKYLKCITGNLKFELFVLSLGLIVFKYFSFGTVKCFKNSLLFNRVQQNLKYALMLSSDQVYSESISWWERWNVQLDRHNLP